MPEPEPLNKQGAAAPQAAAATATPATVTPAAAPAAATALPNAPAASVAGSSATPAAATPPPKTTTIKEMSQSMADTSAAATTPGAVTPGGANASTGTSVVAGVKSARDATNDEGGDKAADTADEAGGVVKDAKEKLDTEGAMKGLAITSGAIGALSGIKAMAESLQTIMDPEGEKLDQIEAGMSMGEGAAGTVGAGADITNEVASEGSKAAEDSEAVSSWSGGIGDAFTAIKSAFVAMKDIVNLVKERTESSNKEKAIEALGVAQSLVDSAKSTLSTINGIKEAIDGGTFGGVAAAIPGLDIALSGITIIKQGFYLAVAAYDFNKLKKDKEAKLADKGELAVEAEQIRIKESKISNLKTAISKDEVRLMVIEEKLKTASDKKGKFGESEKVKLETEKVEITTRKVAMDAELNSATTEKASLEDGKDNVLEFALVGEIGEANKKRIIRNSILLVAEFANLAGSITNLSGAGAVVGAGLKTASASVKVALPAAREAKQAGRDRAADAEAKGETNMASRVFDASKSTAAKRDYRVKQVKILLEQIKGLSKLQGPQQDERAIVLEGYISALGVSPKRLYALTPDQDKQIAMLYKGLIQRE